MFFAFFDFLIYPFLEILSGIYPEFVQFKNFNFFYILKMSGFICIEYLPEFFMSGICGHFPDKVKFRISTFVLNHEISRHFPDIFQIHPDIFDDIFRTFIFHRVCLFLDEGLILFVLFFLYIILY